MGAVDFSLSQPLCRIAAEALPASVFVETGTFRGETVEAVADLFATVYTIELSPELSEQAQARLDRFSHVTVCTGDSPGYLSPIAESHRHEGVLFWLDAHWCSADATAGETSQCPLLGEIGAIEWLNDSSAILIDDARLFLAAPPTPHEISQWPRLQEVVDGLLRLSRDHEISVINDVIAFTPKRIGAVMRGYAQAHGMDLLRMVSDAKSKSELEKAHAEASTYAEQLAAEVETLRAAAEERLRVIEEQQARIKQLEARVAELQGKKAALKTLFGK